ncbi:MAG: mechanosensitive ion channel protein [Planctomycetota bacterium]|nr:MAG: mechanosensitive ion channel protein [Planctomycetota bacterium]
MTRTTQEALEWISAYLPENQIAQAAIIVVFALVMSRVVSWLIGATFKKLAGKTKSDVDDRVVELMHGPMVKTVVLAGLGLATTRLGLDKAAESITIKIIFSLGVVVWTVFLPRLCSILLGAASATADSFKAVQPTTLPLFNNLGKVVVFALAVFAVIAIWDVDATGWLASAGIVGLAVGFAAQDTLSNLFAGVFIIADAPYKVGDFIVLDSGERGQVTHIGLRSTRLLTRDDIEISVPNAVMGQAKITNETGGPHTRRRLRVPVGVAYGSDIEKVRRLLLKAANEEELISDSPIPRVRFRAFGPSSLDFELLCWIPEPLIKGQAIDALLCGIDREFRENQVEIPFPQQDINFKGPPIQGAQPIS